MTVSVEPIEFIGQVWQGRPKGGYWLPREFHAWPEVAAAGVEAIGTFVSSGIWAASFDTTQIPRRFLRYHGNRGTARRLTEVGLWTPSGDHYTARTMESLRSGRGRSGIIMLISRLLPDSPAGSRAGFEAIGLWAITASWSLNNGTPGYIPKTVVRPMKRPKLTDRLCSAGLWIPSRNGFYMSRGDHPIEMRWAVGRDDERASIPDEIRHRVYERDEYACLRCGVTEDLSLDHIVPWSHGGPDTEDNLQTLCRPCNSSKGTRI